MTRRTKGRRTRRRRRRRRREGERKERRIKKKSGKKSGNKKSGKKKKKEKREEERRRVGRRRCVKKKVRLENRIQRESRLYIVGLLLFSLPRATWLPNCWLCVELLEQEGGVKGIGVVVGRIYTISLEKRWKDRLWDHRLKGGPNRKVEYKWELEHAASSSFRKCV